MTKHVFVTGGVTSSLGKGIISASLGRLLKARGLRVVLQKLDPYINVDPGTMNPFEHGEVFVTDDGAVLVDERAWRPVSTRRRACACSAGQPARASASRSRSCNRSRNSSGSASRKSWPLLWKPIFWKPIAPVT